jgi:glycosyltransferase involved in cell wall biosynthesis
MNPIKVLFFTPSLGGGGAEKHLLRVVNHLDRQRFCPAIAVVRSGGSYESALVEDVPLHVLETGRIPSSTVQMIRALRPLRKLVQQEKPDILCSVLGHANTIAALAIRNLPNRPKLVLSVQNPPSLETQTAWISSLFRAFVPYVYPQADRVIALSRGVADDLQRLVPGICDRTDVIYNAGVDSQVLEGATEQLSQAIPRPLIVTCGRLAEQKGYSYLLEAFAQVRRVLPASLWILGEGKLRSQIEQQIQALGLSEDVKLLGFQPNPYSYMAAADVFVLASIYEGFGNVLVEAMACGTPVISTDCPFGPGEIITHNLNGLLVPPSDSNTLAKVILNLLSDPFLQRQLAESGQRRAQDFQSRAIASAYGQVFQDLICDHATERQVVHPTQNLQII